MDLIILIFLRVCSYVVVGIGFSLVLREARALNFAHGHLMLLACWVTVYLAGRGLGIQGILPLLAFFSIAIGFLTYRLIRRVATERTDGDPVLLATIGLGFVAEGVVGVFTNGNSLRFSAVDRGHLWVPALLFAVVLLVVCGLGALFQRRSAPLVPWYIMALQQGSATYVRVLFVVGVGALLSLVSSACLVLAPHAASFLTFVSEGRLAMSWSTQSTALLTIAIGLLALTHFLLQTPLGLLFRGSSISPTLSAQLGFDNSFVRLVVFLYASVVTGYGALVVGMYHDTVRLTDGLRWSLIGFLCAIVAGRRSMWGVLITAGLLGVLEWLCAVYLHHKFNEPLGYLVLAAVLFFGSGFSLPAFRFRRRFGAGQSFCVAEAKE